MFGRCKRDFWLCFVVSYVRMGSYITCEVSGEMKWSAKLRLLRQQFGRKPWYLDSKTICLAQTVTQK